MPPGRKTLRHSRQAWPPVAAHRVDRVLQTSRRDVCRRSIERRLLPHHLPALPPSGLSQRALDLCQRRERASDGGQSAAWNVARVAIGAPTSRSAAAGLGRGKPIRQTGPIRSRSRCRVSAVTPNERFRIRRGCCRVTVSEAPGGGRGRSGWLRGIRAYCRGFYSFGDRRYRRAATGDRPGDPRQGVGQLLQAAATGRAMRREDSPLPDIFDQLYLGEEQLHSRQCRAQMLRIIASDTVNRSQIIRANAVAQRARAQALYDKLREQRSHEGDSSSQPSAPLLPAPVLWRPRLYLLGHHHKRRCQIDEQFPECGEQKNNYEDGYEHRLNFTPVEKWLARKILWCTRAMAVRPVIRSEKGTNRVKIGRLVEG